MKHRKLIKWNLAHLIMAKILTFACISSIMEVNNTQIARNFKFWRRKGDSSPRFMDDKLKIWYFTP